MATTDKAARDVRELLPQWRAQRDALSRLIQAAEAFLQISPPPVAPIEGVEWKHAYPPAGSLKGYSTNVAVVKVLYEVEPERGLGVRELAAAMVQGGQRRDFEKARVNVTSTLKRLRNNFIVKRTEGARWKLDDRVRKTWAQDASQVTDTLSYTLTAPKSELGQRSESK